MEGFSLPSELFAALVGVLITLLLGAIGYGISSFNESRKWRREKRFDLYLAFVRLHKALRAESDSLIKSSARVLEYAKTPGGDKFEFDIMKQESNGHAEVVKGLSAEIDNQMAIARIVGTAKINRHLDRYGIAVSHYFSRQISFSNGEETMENLEISERQYLVAWRLFLEQAQRDLNFSPPWKRSDVRKAQRRHAVA